MDAAMSCEHPAVNMVSATRRSAAKYLELQAMGCAQPIACNSKYFDGYCLHRWQRTDSNCVQSATYTYEMWLGQRVASCMHVCTTQPTYNQRDGDVMY